MRFLANRLSLSPNIVVLGLILILSYSSWASSDKEEALVAKQKTELESLQREMDALRKIRADKLDILEQAETKRWEARYRQNRAVQEHQDKVRSLEGRYSRNANNLSRLNDELMQSRNASADLKQRFEDAQKDLEALTMQIQQAIDKAAEDLSTDFPVRLDQRVHLLGKASSLIANQKKPALQQATSLFFQAKADRLALGQEQEFVSHNTQIADHTDVPAYRLRLGTIFLAEAAREGKAIHVLQRTGALQGKVFEWRADLAETYSNHVRQAVMGAQKGLPDVWLPTDLLQTKSVQNTTRQNQDRTWKQQFKEFFKSGGAVMYPLALVAFLALLLSFERWFLYVRRGRISTRFINRVFKLVDEQRYREAYELCARQKTSMAQALAAILKNATVCSRTAAEKALREAMLREQPLLERRLGLVGALGSSAPLLGLLGTVTGMITLFQVITDVGTNDARILAGGIAEALTTTQSGLVIAIPVLLLHGWLTERLDHITSALGIYSMAMLNKLWPEEDQHSA